MADLSEMLIEAAKAAEDTKVYMQLVVGAYGIHVRGRTWRVDDDKAFAMETLTPWGDLAHLPFNPLILEIKKVEMALMKEARTNG